MREKEIDRLSPLAADVRLANPDRYLATLFAPPARRHSLFALYAFDHEIARVQTIVREPIAGLIRLQWWQDVIDGFGNGKTVAHPVVSALERGVLEDGLDIDCLRRAIDGRRQCFEEEQPSSVSAFERYLVEIGGSIINAAASLLGVDEPDTLKLADRTGLVTAAWEQVRRIETAGPDRKPWLPLAWLDDEADEATFPSHTRARRELAELALDALAEGRKQVLPIGRSALPAWLPATLAGVRLANPTLFDGGQAMPTAAPRLLWRWLLGRF